ncbi:hypothetical protein [Nocardioides sp. zg-1228]|uniref:hypothetical protein n=1 Tax=Nocardioides sp. zg-1228 TaxID=2763008 RepID=UPI00164268CB|nr:hypothetical protein [Nocardioides sp. zg-1228]MBC2934337.1 hypothetical protein [Nocardioides sp. zg-1228]QSF59115.1 hypothetical protein JX575_08090 [Nocardioides sp. zg-1228]
MEFTTIRGDLGAPLEDVAQEAVDATAATYARTPGVDVAATLREHLRGRGIDTTDATVEQLAEAIRAGREVRLGRHDGSVDPHP